MKWRGDLSRVKMNANQRRPGQLSTPPDAASLMSEKKNMEGRHVGLDFYDLLIEVKSRCFVNQEKQRSIPSNMK